MSHFYGWLTGNRGTATRCGSLKSGIEATVQSWQNRVRVHMHDNGKDEEIVDISAHRQDSSSTKTMRLYVNGKEIDIGE